MQMDLVIFQEAGQPVEVRLDARRETVWLTQRQMADVFGTTPENVLMPLKNIFRDGELLEQATTKDFLSALAGWVSPQGVTQHGMSQWAIDQNAPWRNHG